MALNCKEEWTLREFYTRECIGTPYENYGVQYVRRSGNGITLEGKVRWRNRMIIASNPSQFVLGTLPFSLKFLTQVTYIPTCLQCLLTENTRQSCVTKVQSRIMIVVLVLEINHTKDDTMKVGW